MINLVAVLIKTDRLDGGDFGIIHAGNQWYQFAVVDLLVSADIVEPVIVEGVAADESVPVPGMVMR